MATGQEADQGQVSLMRTLTNVALLGTTFILAELTSSPARAEGDLGKVKHIIVVMQENHSFDNYFGALVYAPGSPYRLPRIDGDRDSDDQGGCDNDDHRCVDGLSCVPDRTGNLMCLNSNPTPTTRENAWYVPFTMRAGARPPTSIIVGWVHTRRRISARPIAASKMPRTTASCRSTTSPNSRTMASRAQLKIKP